jgi:hypothetical protein
LEPDDGGGGDGELDCRDLHGERDLERTDRDDPRDNDDDLHLLDGDHIHQQLLDEHLHVHFD